MGDPDLISVVPLHMDYSFQVLVFDDNAPIFVEFETGEKNLTSGRVVIDFVHKGLGWSLLLAGTS
jgi:hypothetical protein